jgi:hypothetical protein
MDFYTIVILIAIVLLIIILTYIGIQLNFKKDSSVQFPPVANTCPDYWVSDGSYCIVPANGKTNIGTIYDKTNGTILLTPNTTYGFVSANTMVGNTVITNPRIDFSVIGWSSMGKSSLCQQKDWSNKYNIIWDGVSNYNNC